MYVDVNSFDRAIAAIQFFDQHLSRDVALLSHIQIVNKFFQAVPGIIPSQDDYFDRFAPDKPDNMSRLEKMSADNTLSKNEKIALFQQEMDEDLRKPLMEVESLPLHFYEDGIEGLKGALKMRHMIAFEHWCGNVTFSYIDIFKKMFPGM